MGNRPDALVEFFWNSPLALRYGVAENLYGIREIADYRAKSAREGGAPKRTLTRTTITTFGFDFATANAEYVRPATGRIGRQSQIWVRMTQGWRVANAHVSLMEPSD